MSVSVIWWEFLAALQRVRPAIAKKPAYPILACVHIEACANGVTLTARNYQESIRAHVHCGAPMDPNLSIRWVVDPARLEALLHAIGSKACSPITSSRPPEILLSSSGFDLVLQCSTVGVRVVLYGLDPCEYPLPSAVD